MSLPNHFYNTALTEGIHSEYLNLSRLPDSYYNGEIITTGPVPILNEAYEGQKLWQRFHFSDYNLPLPLHHPEVNFYPMIEDNENKPSLGGRFVEQGGDELFNFMIQSVRPFTLRADREKLFSLPAVKKIIFSKSGDEIWKDIFSKKILLNSNDSTEKDLTSEILEKSNSPLSYEEMIYNLFLLHMRPSLFHNFQIEKILFFEKNKIGILQVHDIDDRYTTEYAFFFINGIIYSMRLRSMKGHPMAKSIRDLYLNYLTIEESNVDSAQKIYATFRNLPFRIRIEQEGMVYLYAAWSHVTDKVEFLREMIQFLERGPEKIKHLKPLYEYAFKKFGSLLSKEQSAEMKLQTKMSEELEREIELAKKNKDEGKEEDNLIGREREDFLLNRAKREKQNKDQKEKTLDR